MTKYGVNCMDSLTENFMMECLLLVQILLRFLQCMVSLDLAKFGWKTVVGMMNTITKKERKNCGKKSTVQTKAMYIKTHIKISTFEPLLAMSGMSKGFKGGFCAYALSIKSHELAHIQYSPFIAHFFITQIWILHGHFVALIFLPLDFTN